MPDGVVAMANPESRSQRGSSAPNSITLWERLLRAATTDKKHVYSASFFARRDISIVDQQLRAFKLCYALSQDRRTRSKLSASRHIAIVGAGFSGMTCAVALGILHNCTVSVFDRETTLLRNFRRAGFRYIHPELNSRGGWGDYASADRQDKTQYPFLNWSANFAPLVAEEVGRKFDHYRRFANIALHLGEEVLSIEVEKDRPLLSIWSTSDSRVREFEVDMVVVATGLGEERKSDETTDVSYWNSGNPESYRPIKRPGKPKVRVLISGNGDSGIIELAHYLITDFDHAEIFRLLPDPTGFGAFRAPHDFQSLPHRRIGETFHPGAIDIPPPIIWYFQSRIRMDHDRTFRFFYDSKQSNKYAKMIFNYMHRYLHSHLPRQLICEDDLAAMEKGVNDLLFEMASYEVAALMKKSTRSLVLCDAPWSGAAERELKKRFHGEFEVTVVGQSPSIYSLIQAPQTWFLLRIIELFGKGQFEYEFVPKTSDKKKGPALPTPPTICPSAFDRVVVRHGPSYRSLVAAKSRRWSNILIDDPVLWWEWTGERKRSYHDELSRFFRTNRWERAVNYSAPLDDSRATDRKANFGELDLDRLLLGACSAKKGAEAVRLYRTLKRSFRSKKNSPRKRHLIGRLRTLADNWAD